MKVSSYHKELRAAEAGCWQENQFENDPQRRHEPDVETRQKLHFRSILLNFFELC